MKRSFVVVLLFALAATLASPAAVSSQAASEDLAGITVTGYGEASAPAESAAVQFTIVSDSFYGGPPQAPEVEATPGAEARATVAPIVDALGAVEGVEDVTVAIPMISAPYSPAPVARLEVTVTAPDLDMLTRLVTTATQAAAAERLMVGYVGARFEASDCATLEREARQAALDDARRQAEIQAEVLGVGLGDIVASVDVTAAASTDPYYGLPVPSASGCDPEIPAGRFGDPALAITLPPFDPTRDSGEVEVYRQVQVTFAIAGDTATPAA